MVSKLEACYDFSRSFPRLMLSYKEIESLLGADKALLTHKCETIAKENLHLPTMENVEKVFEMSDRPAKVRKHLKDLYSCGRLADTGYLSILPVDQGVEHSAGASFAANPSYFDPEAIVKLAMDGGCNAVASTLGVLGMVSGAYADKIPFIVKINHNELLTYPNKSDQVMFATVQQAKDMGAIGVGATIYFGSETSANDITEVSIAFAEAHRLGLFTVLWCYLRNPAFNEGNLNVSADLTGQANYLGVTIEADIIKQKLPEGNGGFLVLGQESSYGKTDKRVYENLTSDNPIDLARFQVANCFAGRIPLINSGGASGDNDMADAVKTAVINKRAGGSGLISGRKAFQKPTDEGIALLHAIQDVYLCEKVTIA